MLSGSRNASIIGNVRVPHSTGGVYVGRRYSCVDTRDGERTVEIINWNTTKAMWELKTVIDNKVQQGGRSSFISAGGIRKRYRPLVQGEK